jgi:hypothetical protein
MRGATVRCATHQTFSADCSCAERNQFGSLSVWLWESRTVRSHSEGDMNGLIYLVGLIVVIMAILSLFGLR